MGSIDSEAVQDLVSTACRMAATVMFTRWAGPFTVSARTVMCAGLCSLFFRSVARIKTESQIMDPTDEAGKCASQKCTSQNKKEAIFTFMKRFVLTIALAVATMYTSLYVSGATVKLGSAMLAVAWIAFFVMSMWLAQELDTQTLNELKEETPLMRHVINILQSNWVRAIVLGGLHVIIPLIVILDKVRQQVRKKNTKYYSEDSVSERMQDQHTPSGRRLREALAKWNWRDILGKV